MPPRVPLVLVFFACYFSVIAGGGVEALSRFVAAPAPAFLNESLGVEEIRLSVAELIAALAALVAAPDAALRPATTLWDRSLSVIVAAGSLTVAALAPQVATLGYGALTALALGDAVAALFVRRSVAFR